MCLLLLAIISLLKSFGLLFGLLRQMSHYSNTNVPVCLHNTYFALEITAAVASSNIDKDSETRSLWERTETTILEQLLRIFVTGVWKEVNITLQIQKSNTHVSQRPMKISAVLQKCEN